MKEIPIETKLKEVLGKKLWSKLTPKVREHMLVKYEKEYNKETKIIEGTINTIREYNFNTGLLSIGIVLGIVGSFLVNAFDRIYLNYFGNSSAIYNGVIMVIGLIVLLLIVRQFDRLNEDILKSNKTIRSWIDKSKK